MLQIKKYSKRYNQTLVLQIPNLSLSTGVYWFKGENGSGKSTLFKSLAGLLPFEGEIQVEDLDLKKNPVRYRKLVNYAEAEPLFPGFLTAKDLIRFVGKTKGSGLEQQNYYTQLFGVHNFFEKTCETFSSGMMKKLSLVLAFLGDPKIIILDEPLITLDEEAQKILLGEVIKLLNEKTFLISSHQLIDQIELPIKQIYRIHNKELSIV